MLFLLSTLAVAADITPTFDGNVGASYWRLGLGAELKPGVKVGLPWQDPENVLLADPHTKVRATMNAAPSYVRGGGELVFAPIAMLDIGVYGNASYYFGNFQTLIGYDHWTTDYGTNEEIAAYVDAGGLQTTGRALTGGSFATLKAKAGPIVVAAKGDLSRWYIRSDELEASYSYTFEREKEVMMRLGAAGGDTLWQFNGLVMYERTLGGGQTLRVGSMTTRRKSLTADDLLFRTGAIFYLANGEDTLRHIVIAQAYLQDRTFDTALPPFVAYQLQVRR